MTSTYTEISKMDNGVFEKILFQNDATKEYSVCFYNGKEHKYSRPISNGTTCIS